MNQIQPLMFSLIVPTLNRIGELERLFESLAAQNYRHFEVILVDQNTDDRLVCIVEAYRRHFPLLHLRESQRGQSRARNTGFKHVRGDIVAFPDDDCVYPGGLLARIARFFEEKPQWEGLLTRVFDLDEDQNAFERCGDAQSRELDFVKAYKNGISAAIFFRAAVAQKIAFDETMGPGAGTPWACGDDTDYLFRCLKAGFRFYYDADLIVRHPNPRKAYRFGQLVRREYTYGLGNGHFLAKHRLQHSLLSQTTFSYPFYRLAFMESLRGNLRRAAFHFMHGLGTWKGYRAGNKIHGATEAAF